MSWRYLLWRWWPLQPDYKAPPSSSTPPTFNTALFPDITILQPALSPWRRPPSSTPTGRRPSSTSPQRARTSQIIDHSQHLSTRNKLILHRKMDNNHYCWVDHFECSGDRPALCGEDGCGCGWRCECQCQKDEQYHRFDREHQELFGRAIDDGKMIEVSVGSGDNHKVFLVHEMLLRSTSEFFEKALGGQWKESKERAVGLPDEDPEVFSVYQKWLLLNKCIINSRYDTPMEAMEEPLVTEAAMSDSKSQSSSASTSADPSAGIFDILLESYILGDHLLDAKFKNAIIDEVLQLINMFSEFPKKWVSVLWKRLPESSGLMRLYEDLWARRADGNWFEEISTDSMDDTTAYLILLAKKALDFRGNKGDSFGRPCKYYDGTCKTACHNPKPKSVSSEGFENAGFFPVGFNDLTPTPATGAW